MITLILTRHGQTDWNEAGLVSGATDKPKLTKKGKRQAKDLGKSLTRWNVDIVYSSPLGRAKETSKIINAHLGKEVIVAQELIEQSLGELEGSEREKFFGIRRKLDEKSRASYKPKGGESWLEFQARIHKFVKTLIKKHNGQTVLVSSHGAVVRAAIIALKKIPYEHSFEFLVNNSSLTVFKIEKGKIVEELINDVEHLKHTTI